MGTEYKPSVWRVIVCLVIAWLVSMVPGPWLQGWQPWIMGGLFAGAAAEAYNLVHTSIINNLVKSRESAAELIKQMENVDDHRLRALHVYFPEMHLKPLDEWGKMNLLIENTTVTREFLIKILTHAETTHAQIAPVRSFPQRGGQQIMAAEFHRLAQTRHWASAWNGNQTSKWETGWSPDRVLLMYGCDDGIEILKARNAAAMMPEETLEV